MYYLKNICFICLSDKKPLKAVFREETVNETIARIKYAIPELFALDSEIPVKMCNSCYKELSLHTMTDLLEIYNRFKRYIETLQGASYTRDKKCSELQIRVLNCGEFIKQEVDIDLIKEDCEDSVLFCSESEVGELQNLILQREDKILKPESLVLEVADEGSAIQRDNQLIIKKEFQDILFLYETSKEVVKQQQENEDTSISDQDDTNDIEMKDEINEKCTDLENTQNKPVDQNRVDGLTIAELKRRNKWYKCLICMKVLANNRCFRRHGRTHFKRGQRPKCSVCDRQFNTFRILNTHMKFHPQPLEFKCTVCPDRFSTDKELISHISSHENGEVETDDEENIINLIIFYSTIPKAKREYKCLACSEVLYPCVLTVKEHKKKHMKVWNENKCAICNKVFPNRTNFLQHGRDHQIIEDGTKCPICKFKYPVYRDLLEHYRKHLNIKNYQCLICNKFFLKQCELNKHFRVHILQNDFMCYFCKDYFARQYDLKQHLKSHLRNSQLPCHGCNKKFSNSKKLYLHFKLYNCLKKPKTQTSKVARSNIP